MSETPLFCCEEPYCAEEVSYPVGDLRVYEGKRYCNGCWDERHTVWIGADEDEQEPLRWHDLEPFVPEHERTISTLRERVAELEQGVRQCGFNSRPYGEHTKIRRADWMALVKVASGEPLQGEQKV